MRALLAIVLSVTGMLAGPALAHAGAVYVAPASVPPCLWAKDGGAMYQEAGFGPSATRLVTA